MEALSFSQTQEARFAQLEDKIKHGLKTFIEVGEALAEIKQTKLYLLTHETFENYLKDRWNICRSRGYQIIEGAEAAREVSNIVDIKNESIAREVAKLPTKTERKKAAKEIASVIQEKKAKNKKPVVSSKEAKEIVSKIQTKAKGGLAAEAAKFNPVREVPKAKSVAKLFETDASEIQETPHAIISKWWSENKRRLCEYPAAGPEIMVQKILQLFA